VMGWLLLAGLWGVGRGDRDNSEFNTRSQQ
jgi:hypothetical protein